jgi:hypothetical protein
MAPAAGTAPATATAAPAPSSRRSPSLPWRPLTTAGNAGVAGSSRCDLPDRKAGDRSRFGSTVAQLWRSKLPVIVTAHVRLRRRSSPGSASASWLLWSIASSVGVAAETAALVLAADANLASVGARLAAGGSGRQSAAPPRAAALWCEHLLRRRDRMAFGRGAAGTGVAPQAGRGIPGAVSCRGWVGGLAHRATNVVTRTWHCRTSPIRSPSSAPTIGRLDRDGGL